MMWPFLDAVTALTLHEPERSLPLLRRLTPRWSAEFAVRPFIDAHPEIAFRHLAEWASDPDEHVRRLVSEGSGAASPTPQNDIAKDHPDLAVAVARAWLDESGTHVDPIVRHGLRSLIKAGHSGALTLVGVHVDAPIDVVAFTADPPAIAIGGGVSVTCTVVSRGGEATRAEIDLRTLWATTYRPAGAGRRRGGPRAWSRSQPEGRRHGSAPRM